MFSGGKEGVIFLLNRNDMGKLEGARGGPLQRFQAGNGCGQKDCAQTLGTAFWGRENDGVLYVWDRGDVLRAYNFVNNRFVTTPAAVGAAKPGMTGGPSVSANGSDVGSGIVWAVTTQSTRSGGQAPGTLRAFRASDVSQEIYNSDMNARTRRARRFHQVCAAGGREWKGLRADADEGSERLRPSLRQRCVIAGERGHGNAECRAEQYLHSVDHRQEHLVTRHRRAIRYCRGQPHVRRHSDQRDRRDVVRFASRKSIDPIDKRPALACAGRFLYGDTHIHGAFECDSLRCPRSERFRRPVVSSSCLLEQFEARGDVCFPSF